MGSALQFKPILSVEDGVVDALERPRTQAKAVRRILEIMAARVRERPVHAAVIHADALDEAERLRQEVASLFNCRELYVTDLTPVMGTHAGPGVLGVAWWSEDCAYWPGAVPPAIHCPTVDGHGEGDRAR